MLGLLLDLIYPRLCFACNKNHITKGQSICISCEFKIAPTSFHLIQDNPVAERFYGRVNIEKASSAFSFVKGGLLQGLIHSLKYDNRPEIGIELGKIYGNILKNDPLLDFY
jgi:competence protein ComFC